MCFRLQVLAARGRSPDSEHFPPLVSVTAAGRRKPGYYTVSCPSVLPPSRLQPPLCPPPAPAHTTTPARFHRRPGGVSTDGSTATTTVQVVTGAGLRIAKPLRSEMLLLFLLWGDVQMLLESSTPGYRLLVFFIVAACVIESVQTTVGNTLNSGSYFEALFKIRAPSSRGSPASTTVLPHWAILHPVGLLLIKSGRKRMH